MTEPLWCDVRQHYCRCHDFGKRCEDYGRQASERYRAATDVDDRGRPAAHPTPELDELNDRHVLRYPLTEGNLMNSCTEKATK